MKGCTALAIRELSATQGRVHFACSFCSSRGCVAVCSWRGCFAWSSGSVAYKQAWQRGPPAKSQSVRGSAPLRNSSSMHFPSNPHSTQLRSRSPYEPMAAAGLRLFWMASKALAKWPGPAESVRGGSGWHEPISNIQNSSQRTFLSQIPIQHC